MINSLISKVRILALIASILALSAVSFAPGPVSDAAFLGRFPPLILLLITTVIHRQSDPTGWKYLASAAKAFILGFISLGVLAAILSPFSITPGESLAQSLLLSLLVAIMSSHMLTRWGNPRFVNQDFRIIFWTCTALVGASAVIGFGTPGRLAGLFNNPNALGLVAAMSFALGAGLWDSKKSWLVGLAMMANFSVVLLSESRTALVATFAGIVFVGLKKFRGTIRPLVAVLTCGVGSVIICMVLLLGRLPLPEVARRFGEDAEGGLLNTREDAWRFALELWTGRPWIGYGYRSGEHAFEMYRSMSTFGRDLVHNSYLQMLLEMGVIGSIPLLVVLVILVSALFRLSMSGMVTGTAMLVVIGLIMSLSESALFGVGHVISWLVWLAAGATVTQSSCKARNVRIGESIGSRTRKGWISGKSLLLKRSASHETPSTLPAIDSRYDSHTAGNATN